MEADGARQRLIERRLAFAPSPPVRLDLGEVIVDWRHRGAQTGALEGRVQVAGIAQKRLAFPREQGEEAGPRHRQERPNQPASCQFSHCRHPRQPIAPAAGASPDQVCLALVFSVVRGEQVKDTTSAAPFFEEPIARLARRLLNAARRLGAGPDEGLMRNAAGGEPTGDGARFLGAFGPQPVIDGQRPSLPAALPRPAIG
jgi:hypothetical protein